ncbi:uncharacterized protein LOC119683942 [Teleopsis dalmanni]|uniref:uncharacterized protein LOC119683942 n=1 Tax=Teleopsis dalmanni TaxID=139649 RepID=UPI0018CE69B8|nr:uncharacterized protein LOC119683942 [Teleopsis dalmanni]
MGFDIKSYITVRRVAIFFGLLSTALLVATVCLAVDNSNMSQKFKECNQKLDVFESFIQSLSTTTTSIVTTTTATTSESTTAPETSASFRNLL